MDICVAIAARAAMAVMRPAGDGLIILVGDVRACCGRFRRVRAAGAGARAHRGLGLRLGAHIYTRNRGQGEDKRYASLLRRYVRRTSGFIPVRRAERMAPGPANRI